MEEVDRVLSTFSEEERSTIKSIVFRECRKCKTSLPKIKFSGKKGTYTEKLEKWYGNVCPPCKVSFLKEQNRSVYLKKKEELNTPSVYNWKCECCEKRFTTTFKAEERFGNKIRHCSSRCQMKMLRRKKEGLQKGEGKCCQCGESYLKDKDEQRSCQSCKNKAIARQFDKKDIAPALKREYGKLKKSMKRSARYAKLLKKRRDRLIRLELEKKICETCGDKMPKQKRKYCSKSCAPRSPGKNASRKALKRMKKERKLSCVTWKQIAEFYDKCPNDHEVDHIIPLNNKDVSGLHVPWNFQYLTKEENGRKSNKFDGTYENKDF